MPYDLKRLPRQAEPSGGADAARVGEELREARLALGLSVEEMAVRLRIRRAYLEALEEGRTSDLPGAAYALGFVRSYAAALGLDAAGMVRRYRDATGPVAARPKLVFPEPAAERGLPAGAVMTLGAVIAIGGYVAWFNWSGGGQRTVDVVPPVPPRLEQAAEQGRSQIPGREPGSPGALPLAVLPPPGGLPPSSSGANTSAQAATVPAGAVPSLAGLPAPAPVPVAATAAAPAAVPAAPPPRPFADIPGVPEGTRVVLRAKAGSPEGSWVQVRDPRSGQSLVNRVLRPGEAWAVPVRDGLVLDTGKADALEILVDGQAQPTLEGLVGVRRGIALEPERLRQRIVPASANARN